MSDSLKKRYAYKLGSKLLTLLLGLVTVGIVPKSLGPSDYGTFSFLTFFFARIIKFMKLGTASAFFTKLSARQKESTLIGFYGIILVLISIMVLAFMFGAILVGANETLWPDQLPLYVYAAGGFSLLSLFSKMIHDTNDALGLTVHNELVFITQSVFLTGLILTYYMTDQLDLDTYFFIHYSMQIYLILLGTMIIVVYGKYKFRKIFSLSRERISIYAREFMSYSHPLVFNSIVVLVVGVGDRWLLQKYAGSTEQGYYGLAFKLVSICFLFTTSMMPLFPRELSISHKQNDKRQIRKMFTKNIPLFYFVASYFSVFIGMNAKLIVAVIGGEQYAMAYAALSIIAFYPMHQTYGQMSGAVFLATERTGIIRNIGVSTGIIGIILSVILLTPLNGYGFSLGAKGLAVKLVLIQLVAVNIQLWFNCKYLKLPFIKYVIHQFIAPLILILLAAISSFVSSGIQNNTIVEFFISGIIYTFLTIIIILAIPKLLALERDKLLGYALLPFK